MCGFGNFLSRRYFWLLVWVWRSNFLKDLSPSFPKMAQLRAQGFRFLIFFTGNMNFGCETTSRLSWEILFIMSQYGWLQQREKLFSRMELELGPGESLLQRCLKKSLPIPFQLAFFKWIHSGFRCQTSLAWSGHSRDYTILAKMKVTF